MKPLLRITTVPFMMDVQVQRAKLEISSKNPSYDTERVKGTYTIDHSYPKLLVDSSAARSSMGYKTALEASRESAAKSMQDAKEGAARIAEEGYTLMQIQKNVSVRDVMVGRLQQRIKERSSFNIGPLPAVPADINWEPGSFSMNYEADRLNLDWHTQSRPDYDFTPATVSYRVLQFAKCEFEFLGGPIYVPPSADPDYETPALDTIA